jgi:hypothetical protein
LREQIEAEPWYVWLAAVVLPEEAAPFARHHVDFWQWVWNIAKGEPADPFVGCWARGGAKSSSAEMACVALGARRRRRYGWYIGGTQDGADQHVENIAELLEGDRVEMFYPEMAQRMVGKYGNSRGWRRNRLRTLSGFTLDAVGLDKGARGVKVEEQRPDFFVIDDVDDTHDTHATTIKKVELLTRKLLPAGSNDAITLAIQNLVHPNSIFARLCDGRAEFLANRHVSGPIPALLGMVTEPEHHEGKIRHRIVAGTPTWEGQSLDVCQRQVDDWGLDAFQREALHDVSKIEGAQWCREQLDVLRMDPDAYDFVADVLKSLRSVVTGVDPAGTSGPDADDTGIVTVGRTFDEWCPACGDVEAAHAIVLADYSCHLAPAGWAQRAVDAFDAHVISTFPDRARSQRIVAEKNYGGEMVEYTIAATHDVPVDLVNAEGSKYVRASGPAALFGSVDKPDEWPLGRVHLLGSFPELEQQMTTWRIGDQSPNNLDAFVHAIAALEMDTPAPRGMRFMGAA